MSARAEDAARALSREQPTTADAAVPAPANNGSADAEGVEIPAPEPSGNKNLLGSGSNHRLRTYQSWLWEDFVPNIAILLGKLQTRAPP